MPQPGIWTNLGRADVVETVNADGRGGAVILCEHASCAMPDGVDLGLAAQDVRSHAVWDPGARGMAMHLSRALDAPLVAGKVSRLIYDCNRPPEAPSAMPDRVETIDIPGNRDLSDAERAARAEAVYVPFCAAAEAAIAAQKVRAEAPVLITVHTFTPVYFGKPRDVEIGILNDADARMADAMLDEAQGLPHRVIRRNDPYGPEDGVTHSLTLHGIANGVANVMLEVRSDLVTDAQAEIAVADELLTLIRPAMARLGAQMGGQGA